MGISVEMQRSPSEKSKLHNKTLSVHEREKSTLVNHICVLTSGKGRDDEIRPKPSM